MSWLVTELHALVNLDNIVTIVSSTNGDVVADVDPNDTEGNLILITTLAKSEKEADEIVIPMIVAHIMASNYRSIVADFRPGMADYENLKTDLEAYRHVDAAT